MMLLLLIARFYFLDVAFIALQKICVFTVAIRTGPAVLDRTVFPLAVLAERNAFNHFQLHSAVLQQWMPYLEVIPAVNEVISYYPAYLPDFQSN